MPDDFSPIADEGVLERARGLLGRARRRENLPTVPAGLELIIVAADGKIAGGKDVTAGEKYWTPGASWITVDMGEHVLAYTLPLTDPNGELGYAVTVTLRARVSPGKAGPAAQSRAKSVKPFVEPALREELKRALRDGHRRSIMAAAEAESNLVEVDVSLDVAQPAHFHRALRHVDDALRVGLQPEAGHHGQAVLTGLPEWLTARITSVDVYFDAATNSHLDAILDQRRSWVRKDLDATHSMALRDKWRDHLAPQLENRQLRVIEVILDDPSPDNVQLAVDQLNKLDREGRSEALGVLRSLLEGDYITDEDGVRELTTKAIRAVVDTLQPTATVEPPSPDALVPPGDAIPASSVTGEQRVTPEADEPIDDRDWGSR